MGEVLPLKPSRCPCGWRAPKNVNVELVGPAYKLLEAAGLKAAIFFNCPQCNCRLQMSSHGAKVVYER